MPIVTRTSSEQVADELLRSIASVRRVSRRHSGRPPELTALTGAQLELARLVRRQPGISVTDAAHELKLAANTVSTLVGQLTDEGLIVRHVDETDRRVARLELSADLRSKMDEWRDRRLVALGDAIDALPESHRKRLTAALPALWQLTERLDDQ
ncbi:MAG TPA: MarR family transcriptional regulator [Gaiellaceae bacterium]